MRVLNGLVRRVRRVRILARRENSERRRGEHGDGAKGPQLAMGGGPASDRAEVLR